MSDYFGKEVPKLGFGLMRLPRKITATTDIEQTKKMVDMFMDAGFNYFDTAFIYPGSESATKKALVDRYPRESYILATKLNAFISAPTEKIAKKEFMTSLERTGAGYFDYYLLHSLKESIYRRYDKFHLWDYVKELKEQGLIKHYGFSYHDGPELLDQLLTEHPDVDFVQLQINYADWDNPSVQARENYEVASRHGKSIIVMEPVKGGSLANPPAEVRKLFDDYDPNMSYASWAIRFAASLDGIITVLSGMSNIEQMQDNISFMKDFKPLNEEEQEIIRQAQILMGKSKVIQCTACGYCLEGCPQRIRIPEVFAAANKQLGNGQMDEAKAAYREAVSIGGKASQCIGCRKCENACPQKLKVVDLLKQASEMLEDRNRVQSMSLLNLYWVKSELNTEESLVSE
ncbi:MAG: aldo/keto reductase [Candidatus Methanomethylophilaceae archaeon]|nr:aldo/keto reductase [Candidatus Methanomethylophilaceae archaeon]